MRKAPSRNPEDYTASSHFQNRLKYNTDPRIPEYIIEMAIKDGTYLDPETDDYGGEPCFKIVSRVEGEMHEFTLGVDPESMNAVSIYCHCHQNGNDCRPHHFWERERR